MQTVAQKAKTGDATLYTERERNRRIFALSDSETTTLRAKSLRLPGEKHKEIEKGR